MDYDLDYLVAAASTAMLGNIKTNVKLISVSYGIDKVFFYYFYDSDLTAENTKDIEQISQSLIGPHFPVGYQIESIVKRIDKTSPAPLMGRSVYRRKGVTVGRSEYDLQTLEFATIKSLIGLVTPSLRKVCVSIGGHHLFLHCFFHGEISDEQREDMRNAASAVRDRFPPDYEVHLNMQRVDWPEKTPWIGALVYLKKEVSTATA